MLRLRSTTLLALSLCTIAACAAHDERFEPEPEARSVGALEVDPIAEGKRLFTEETFGGNGRTCATCHVLSLNARLTPANVAERFAKVGETFDPLFIAEPTMNLNTLTINRVVNFPDGAILVGSSTHGTTVRARVLTRVSSTKYLVQGGISPAFGAGRTVRNGTTSARVVRIVAGDLTALESPAKLRGKSTSKSFPQGRALILVNPDDFDHHVFRKSPHLQNLQLTSPFGFDNRFGLEEFSVRAVRQHFTRSIRRREGIDFRLPTAEELEHLSAFMLSLRSVPDFNQAHFARTAAQRRGQNLFLAAGCGGCHFDTVLGGRGEDPFVFATGVNNQPINGRDGDRLPPELPVDAQGRSLREIAVPGLFNLKNNAPFFHDASAATLEEVIAFYRSDTFAQSDVGRFIDIRLTDAQVPDLVTFLSCLVARNYVVEVEGVDVTRADTTVDLGTVPATGATSKRTLTVKNTSDVPVKFRAPACQMNGLPGSTPADFGVDCDALAGAKLSPGGSRDITVSFHPARQGKKNAILELLTDDPTGVDLVGEGQRGVGPLDGVTDRFNDDTDGPPPNWELVRGGSFRVSGGQLRMTKCSGCVAPNGNLLLNGFTLPERFTLTVRAIATAGDNDSNDFSVIFNFRDRLSYYYANFNERLDKAGLFKLVDGVKIQLSPFPTTTTPGDGSAKLHAIRIEKLGGQIRVFADGALFADVTDDTFTGGRAGLGSLNDSGRFDDFDVVEVVDAP
jgi:hypothetical protein